MDAPLLWNTEQYFYKLNYFFGGEGGGESAFPDYIRDENEFTQCSVYVKHRLCGVLM